MTRTIKIPALAGGIFLMASFLGAPLPSFAEEAPKMAHPVFGEFTKGGGSVDFLGHAYGLDGWIVTNPEGNVQSVYTTPEGGLVIGMLFSPDGASETAKQFLAYKKKISGESQDAVPGAEKLVVKAEDSKAEKVYAETEKASWVALGDEKAPYMYIMVNTTCEHCLEFWKDVAGMVDQGQLQVRLIPFGQSDDNRDGGAALLSAENPAGAWKAYVAGDKAALGKDKAKAEAYTKIDGNNKLSGNWKGKTAPFALYRRPADGVIQAIAGRPENMMLLQADFLK